MTEPSSTASATTADAIPAAPLPATTAAPTPRAYLATLRIYVGPQWPKALALGGLMLADISLDLLGPQVQKRFIDGALGGMALADLLRIALVFLGIALTTQVLFVISNYLATDIAQIGTNRLRQDLLSHVLRLDYSFHNSHSPGVLIERIDGDVALLSNFLSRFILELVGSVLLLAGALALLFRIDWRIGATLTVFALVTLGILKTLFGVSRQRWEADRATWAELYGFLEERFAGTEDIRASGATAYVMRRFFERARAASRTRLIAGVLGSGSWGVSIFMLTIGTAIALGIGAYLYREGSITIGTVYLILAYSQLLDGPINSIARQVQDLQQAGAAIGRVGQLLTTESRVRDPETPRPLPEGPLALAFDAVDFAYQAGEPVLHGIALDLPAGRSIGLLGRTGSGKTTLTRLIFRLLDPSAGSVRLAGVDLRDVAAAELRRHVALVTQEVQLFHASLRDNLTFFDPTADDARIRAAIESAGLGAWLASLPEGLDTQLAPGGGGLSAGQAQLLALARAFLGDPGLVVLDEASSRLDPTTEAEVERVLDRLFAGRTVIVIAHRLATVRRVDEILILEGGAVVEHGPRDALAADPGSRFARLLAAGEEVLDDVVA